jgi:hypothetical protein
VQLLDNCEGVYITERTAKGFTVKELRGGNSNAKFQWFVSANRKDVNRPYGGVVQYQDLRYPKMPAKAAGAAAPTPPTHSAHKHKR